MSEPFADAVRWPVDPADVRLRTSDRLLAQLPSLLSRLARRFEAEPPGSRLRRWVIDRALLAGFAATDAGDWDFLSRIYEPDVQLHVEPGAGIPGYPARADGYEALRALLQGSVNVWGTLESRPTEMIDPGGRQFATVVEHGFTGSVSGLAGFGSFVYMYEMSETGRCSQQWWAGSLDGAERFYRNRLAELEGFRP